jgi:acetyl-CoA synthetase
MGTSCSDDHSHRDFEELYDRSLRDPEGFWSTMAMEELDWNSTWDRVIDVDREVCTRDWFPGDSINASYNCLDRHVMNGNKVKAALIWQGESKEDVRILTYGQMLYEVGRFSNVLKELGIGKGDSVSIYLPMIPELAIAMLACARIGAVHNVILAGFSADAIRTRVEDCDSRLVVTSDGAFRGGGLIPLKFNVDMALADGGKVRDVVVVRRTSVPVEMIDGRDIWWNEAMSEAPPRCEPVGMESDHPLFTLYTSGFTSAPKGVLHSTAGYLLHAVLSYRWMFLPRDDDVHWCTGDLGWITGHTYSLYGPLCAGSITLMYEGAPTYPTEDRYWQIVEKYGVNSLYTTPTTVRALMKGGVDPNERWDLLSLRMLGVVGEPIDPETLG